MTFTYVKANKFKSNLWEIVKKLYVRNCVYEIFINDYFSAFWFKKKYLQLLPLSNILNRYLRRYRVETLNYQLNFWKLGFSTLYYLLYDDLSTVQHCGLTFFTAKDKCRLGVWDSVLSIFTQKTAQLFVTHIKFSIRKK